MNTAMVQTYSIDVFDNLVEDDDIWCAVDLFDVECHEDGNRQTIGQ